MNNFGRGRGCGGFSSSFGASSGTGDGDARMVASPAVKTGLEETAEWTDVENGSKELSELTFGGANPSTRGAIGRGRGALSCGRGRDVTSFQGAQTGNADGFMSSGGGRGENVFAPRGFGRGGMSGRANDEFANDSSNVASFGGYRRERGSDFALDRNDGGSGDSSRNGAGRGMRGGMYGGRTNGDNGDGAFTSINVDGNLGRDSSGGDAPTRSDPVDDESKYGRPAPQICPANFIPEERSLVDMYSEDASNAKYEIGDLDLEVTVTGVPASMREFKLERWQDTGFEEVVVKNLTEKCHYTIPRRIQAAGIPLIVKEWDLLGHAETGSGKTLAFILPIVDRLMKQGQPNDATWAPVALVIAPTRELAAQIYDQTRKVTEGTGVTSARCYGRIDVRKNLEDIGRGCNILVATVGRLMDFVKRGRIRLCNLKFLVLDEADKMLEAQGFRNEMLELTHFHGFPSKEERQTLLFSATFDAEVQSFAKDILKTKYAFVSNGKHTAANPRVQQNFIEVQQSEKLMKLCEMLEAEKEGLGEVGRTLVFVTRKVDADAVAMFLSAKNIRACSIHGDREQQQRENALKEFRDGVTKVLIATDVCARGIDVADLEHVINYDLPTESIVYVHRIGRTGRLHKGKATTFLNPGSQDRDMAPDLLKIVREAQQEAPEFLVNLAGGGVTSSGMGHASFGGGMSRYANSTCDFGGTGGFESLAKPDAMVCDVLAGTGSGDNWGANDTNTELENAPTFQDADNDSSGGAAW